MLFDFKVHITGQPLEELKESFEALLKAQNEGLSVIVSEAGACGPYVGKVSNLISLPNLIFAL